jgi:transcription elongation factor Elf1
MDFNTHYTSNIVCPYCGHEDRDSWEVDFGPGMEGDTRVWCGNCDEEFNVSRNVEVSYTSFPIKK